MMKLKLSLNTDRAIDDDTHMLVCEIRRVTARGSGARNVSAGRSSSHFF